MIELRFEGIKAIIDTKGAWLTNLADEKGDILFPKRAFHLEDGNMKQRGGCHVCLPNFGPGGTHDQPQHGFGREVEWTAEDIGDNYLLLALKEGPGSYKELSSTLTYILEDSQLEIILDVSNNSKDDELWVAPGLHPYFALQADEKAVRVNGETQSLGELAEVQFAPGEAQHLELEKRTVTLMAENLPIWARWTDQLGQYVCVEPTLSGFAFLKNTPDTTELLAPGEQKKYALTIRWADGA